DLLADWFIEQRSINNDLKYGVLQRLWERAKSLYQNNPYFVRYVQLVSQNVLGANGFKLRVSLDERGTGDPANIQDYATRVQESFVNYVETSNVDGHSWFETQRLALNMLLIFGDGFLVFLPNDLSFQVVSPLFCPPENLQKKIGNKTVVFRLGVGYIGNDAQPSYYRFVDADGRESIIPADRVVHFRILEFPEQIRGYPRIASAMIQLHHLEGYEEAELVAARIAAAKMGFFKRTVSDIVATQESGDLIDEVRPGELYNLPPGVEVEFFDPKHPNSSFSEFQKAILRSVASALGVSYVSLANDLESVNYSSARVGLLEEREYYKTMQRIFQEQFLNPLFWKWYNAGVQAGTFDRQNVIPKWYGRTYDWVDPLKDAEALAKQLNLGLKSFTEILAQQGKDIDEHIEELKAEKEKIIQAGIILPFGYE
ncbi:MAG: phage portal protein, partial [Candidatus Hydrothermia bacterium]